MPGPIRLASLPLWEPRWSQAALAAKRSESMRAFSRGMMMLPFSDEERIFPSVTKCYEYGVCTGDVIRGGSLKFLGVDLAGDKRPGNALVAIGLDPGTKRRYVIKVEVGAWTSPKVAERIAVLDAEMNFRVICVENNGYQQALVDWMRHMKVPCWYKVRATTTTGKTKHDPELGVRSLEVEFANKAWVIPAAEFESHAAGCVCGWCVFRRSIEDYPNGSATDTVMALWFARQALNLYAAPVGGTRIEGLNAR